MPSSARFAMRHRTSALLTWLVLSTSLLAQLGCETVDKERLMEQRRYDAEEYDKRIGQTNVHLLGFGRDANPYRR
jgi:hypothetical protein